MTELMTYHARLRVPPDRAFAILLRLVTERGRLHEVQGYGTALTFTPRLPAPREPRLLRAQVRLEHGETLLTFDPAEEHAGQRWLDRQAEQAWMSTTIEALCAHLARTCEPPERAAPPRPRRG